MSKTCTGCGKELGLAESLYWDVCMDCTKARHKAAVNHGRCSCGRKRRERVVETRSRRWVACDRCLGTVRQLPDRERG